MLRWLGVKIYWLKGQMRQVSQLPCIVYFVPSIGLEYAYFVIVNYWSIYSYLFEICIIVKLCNILLFMSIEILIIILVIGHIVSYSYCLCNWYYILLLFISLIIIFSISLSDWYRLRYLSLCYLLQPLYWQHLHWARYPASENTEVDWYCQGVLHPSRGRTVSDWT